MPRTVPAPEKIVSKKALFHAGPVWLEALRDFENELLEHLEEAKKDELKFQTGRLYDCLIKRIKAHATGLEQWYALFYCYRWFVAKPSLPGYDETRRLHCEEMAARGLSLPGEFCSHCVISPDELTLRVRSIASWVEAQTSFSFWLGFTDLRKGWRGKTLDARASAIQACYLSQLPQKLLMKTKRTDREVIGAYLRPELGIGTNYDNKPWDARQWQNILEQAARLAGKRFDCPEVERWLWWCYSVFRRYGWNTREVRDAAIQRGLNETDEMPEENFRRRMLTMGLPLRGKKQTRTEPPLADFVRDVALPDSGKMWGRVAGFLTKTNF
jgi:hypothetical protein